MTINLNVSIEKLVEELNYLECPITQEHALVHVVAAIGLHPGDPNQVEHDLNIAHSILKVLVDGDGRYYEACA